MSTSTTLLTLPTSTVTSPGSYYHRHIKPGDGNNHLALDPVHADEIPSTATPIAADSGWLLATEYSGEPRVLTVWINASKSQLVNGLYYGMRFANVESHHVGALHGFGRKSIVRELTDDELADRLAASIG